MSKIEERKLRRKQARMTDPFTGDQVLQILFPLLLTGYGYTLTQWLEENYVKLWDYHVLRAQVVELRVEYENKLLKGE